MDCVHHNIILNIWYLSDLVSTWQMTYDNRSWKSYSNEFLIMPYPLKLHNKPRCLYILNWVSYYTKPNTLAKNVVLSIYQKLTYCLCSLLVEESHVYIYDTSEAMIKNRKEKVTQQEVGLLTLAIMLSIVTCLLLLHKTLFWHW